MKNLLREEDIIQSPFFQLPKDLFHSLAYRSMRLESKVAYTILLDLLPLSIQNRWVNEKGEVFVKLSRKKLMALLGIKGTQKMAQVMKELENRQLIVNKRVGLTKCNEIFLYPLDSAIPVKQDHKPQDLKKKSPHRAEVAQVPVAPVAKESIKKEPQETKSNQTKLLETPNPRAPYFAANPTHLVDTMDTMDTTVALAEVQDLLENHIHAEDLKQKYNPEFVDEICNNICEMFLNTTTRIGQQDKPQVIMRGVIRKLKMHHIEHVVDQFRQVAATTEILNPKRYLQTMIYNSIHEANTRILGHIRYHFGYC